MKWKWNPQDIRDLSKKVFGNCSDETILAKLAELQTQLRQYESSFLHLHTKHEWAEVQRLADEISAMMSEPFALGAVGEIARRGVSARSHAFA